MTTLSDDFVAQPTAAQGYLIGAQAMLAGALPLEHVEPIPVIALTLLCGLACETALKAMLAESGLAEKELRSTQYGHDIPQLWITAAQRGSSLPSSVPDWVAQLARVYGEKYHLRYPMGLHGIVLPNPKQLLRGTTSLVSLAASHVK